MLLTLMACQTDAPLVVLVSLDTTRADRLGPYGHPDAGTPTLDGLAARGVTFETALAPSSTTLLSHTAVMSGRDSHQSGVVRNGYPVPPGLPLLAERFAEAGWDTLGVVGASPLEDAMGLGRGFRVWHDHDLLPYLGQVEVGADVVNASVFELLERRDRKPTLLFVHYYDAHMPWTSAPPETVSRFVSRDAAKNGFVIKGIPDGRRVERLSELDRAEADGRYQAEISWADDQLGELLEGLDRRGLMQDSLVVVFSDHGESMGEDPRLLLPYGHGPDVDKGIVHVPLIVAATGSFQVPEGERVARQVRLLDIGTTVLSLTGLGGTLGVGQDLSPLWAGDTSPPPLSFAEATKPIPLEDTSGWNNLPFQRSVADGSHLLVVTPLEQRMSMRSLATGVEVDTPPDELARALGAWDASAPPHREPTMSDETINALKQLGYLE